MTMPTNQKTWSFDTNNSVNTGNLKEDAKLLLFGLKDSMVTAGWTVQLSSDGSNYGAFDYWGDENDVVFNYTSGGRSWIVLRNTNLGPAVFEVLIHCRRYVSDPYCHHTNFEYSLTGFSGGDTDNPPTAADQVALVPISTSSSVGFAWIPSTTSQRYWSAMWSSDGECFRFIMNQGGVPTTAFSFEKLSNPATDLDDVDKVLIINEFCRTTAPTNKLEIADLYSTTGCVGNIDGNEVNYYLTQECRAGARITELTAPNPQEGGGEWPLMPIGVLSVNNTAYSYGRCGEPFDLWWGAESLVNGSTFPGDGSKTHVKFGDLVFPWDGSSPLIS